MAGRTAFFELLIQAGALVYMWFIASRSSVDLSLFGLLLGIYLFCVTLIVIYWIWREARVY